MRVSQSIAARKALEKQWYCARDTVLGDNCEKQDIRKGLALAATCQHNDARWLTEICDGKDLKTAEDIAAVLRSQEKDSRALCFAAMLSSPVDMVRLRRSAESGCALAEFQMARESSGAERYRWALRAALQGERNGFCLLGVCLRDGEGCIQNVCLAQENFLRAASLDCLSSKLAAADLMDDANPKRWKWLGEIAVKDAQFPFFESFAFVVSSFKNDRSFGPAVFAIGRALEGHVNFSKREIFGESWDFDKRVGLATEAIDLFHAQCRAARSAVDTWTLIAAHVFFLSKDIRRMIGEMIWEARERADYPLQECFTSFASLGSWLSTRVRGCFSFG